MGWLFNPPSDAVALALSPLAYFWGYVLLRGAEHRTLGVHWAVWTIIITFGLSFDAGVLHLQWPVGLAGLALSVAESWITWRLLSVKPPVQKG